ncbi:DUF167 domain-containing protein [Desulfovibrio sp. OttesenSCG-928-F07]|nr:DUF167 domain-containing protein [Desulfovibrio sp. OttesenSCG-928-F07]
MSAVTQPDNTEPVAPFIIRSPEGWYILIKVQPGAKKSELCGLSEDMLKIRLAAPAVDNKANQALVEFIAEKLQIRKNKVTLASGEKSRKKKLFISHEDSPYWNGIFN